MAYANTRKRWLAPWEGTAAKPAIYHCLSRVVDRRFVFGDEEREAFRMFMRMYENFSGCRVLSYCVMSNHFHLLLEVPPMPKGGLSDEELLKRLGFLHKDGFMESVRIELSEARAEVALEAAENLRNGAIEGAADGGFQDVAARRVEGIRAPYLKRMHDLGHYMKTVLQCFTRWFNRRHSRTGTLWEDRFKSVIVESGMAARMMAAYIDLNPVRAGMLEYPADYRWSSYGEAVGGGMKGNGKKVREGLVRAITSDTDTGFDASGWKNTSRRYRRLMGLALQRKPGSSGLANSPKVLRATVENGLNEAEAAAMNQESGALLPDLSVAKMLRCRVRYFTDGAVIGSKDFVNEPFAASRERFSEKRKNGARKMRGNGKAAAGLLWSVRDLRLNI